MNLFQVTGVVHEVNDNLEIVDKFYPGSICGIKHILDTSNLPPPMSLKAHTEVEMLEFVIGCSNDQFYAILNENPHRFPSLQPLFAAFVRIYFAFTVHCKLMRPKCK